MTEDYLLMKTVQCRENIDIVIVKVIFAIVGDEIVNAYFVYQQLTL